MNIDTIDDNNDKEHITMINDIYNIKYLINRQDWSELKKIRKINKTQMTSESSSI